MHPQLQHAVLLRNTSALHTEPPRVPWDTGHWPRSRWIWDIGNRPTWDIANRRTWDIANRPGSRW
eukprot:3516299-Rhodomonas_salina.4